MFLFSTEVTVNGAEAFYYKTATLLASPLSDPTNEPCGCLNLGLIK